MAKARPYEVPVLGSEDDLRAELGNALFSAALSFKEAKRDSEKEVAMKRLTLGLVAAGALVTATAVPALAQVDIYTGPGGVGVQLGAPGYYYDGPRHYRGGYDYAPGYRGYSRPGWHRHHYDHDED
jgi:hypothetical protein